MEAVVCVLRLVTPGRENAWSRFATAHNRKQHIARYVLQHITAVSWMQKRAEGRAKCQIPH